MWLLVENLALQGDKFIISKYPMFNVLLKETDVFLQIVVKFDFEKQYMLYSCMSLSVM